MKSGIPWNFVACMRLRPWSFRVACGLVPLFMAGVVHAQSAESGRYLPEAPDDPPGIPAPHTPGAAPRSAPVTRGAFTAVQVNVDALGANVLGDAANEPSMAIDPTNPSRIAIGWRQFDTIASNFRQAGIGYSVDGGATWTFPGVLDPGQFRSDPVLDADADGNLYYSSLSSETSAELFKSVDGGATWSSPVDAFGGDKQWIAVDRSNGPGRGFIYQAWNRQFSCCFGADFTRSADGGASFEAPLTMPQPAIKWGTLDVSSNGTLYLAGAALNQQSHLFQKSTNAQNSAQTPGFLTTSQTIDLGGLTIFGQFPNPGGLLGHVWIAADPRLGAFADWVYVLASVDPPGADRLDVMFIRSEDGGATWTAPIRVNDDPPLLTSNQWFGTMAVAPNGRIDAIWNDTRNSLNAIDSEVYYSYSIDAGDHWAPSTPITPMYDPTLGYPNQSKIGDYYHMISDENGANLAFAATFNGEQDVYFMRIVPDCNGNGAHDGNDLMFGASSDCNANFAPDDCEPLYSSISAMILALRKPSELGDDICLFDVNGDTLVDGRDIQPFVSDRLLAP
ncbi:MAG TPA: sialidase family protein [Phycisphaerae bacterium]|nr:sialidase family protein [Phycisphaerae bacterium]HRW51748.1 sialidase family protein [Phycisphaerae bacterium]